MSNYERIDNRYRAEMEKGSKLLLTALRHQHAHIIYTLTRPAYRRLP